MKLKETCCFVIFLLLLTVLGINLTFGLSAPPVAGDSLASVASHPSPQEDPNKGPSELNHHLAGLALLIVGSLLIAARLFPRLRGLQIVWPLMFLGLGLFLAAWSDAEIWPRGNVGWGWLLHYDAEARMHKFYAILLLAIGVVEYLRVRGKLPPLWRAWGFPAIAVLGAVLLLFHDHGSGAGLPPESGVGRAEGSAMMAGFVNIEQPPDHGPEMTEMHHQGSENMKHDHNNNNDDLPAKGIAATDEHNLHHHMSPAMLKVEHEHFWFAVVGIAIALFKWVSDLARKRHALFATYVWQSLVVVLGVLLVCYTE
jgi:hypothetical protein